MQRLKAVQSYDIIAFVTGFALLAYELVASRMLAPTIGSSIYVWTSVIGVIIAALSLGYAAGGYLADKRVDPLDVVRLLLISAGAVMFTLIASSTVLNIATNNMSDPRLQGIFASVFLFMPTSFFLGMVSPYLARLKNVSLKTTGTTIASLSALNALGSIFGTFCTGFIFFAYIGSKEALLLISLLLLVSSWFIRPKKYLPTRLATAGLLVFTAISFLGADKAEGATTLDTPSSRYTIKEVLIDGRTIRAITTGPGGLQSGIYTDGSRDLAFTYTKKMAELVELSPHKSNILVLGGGAFTLPQHLSDKYPKSHIDVVEIDPKLLPIARKYFNYRDPANVSVIAQDARTFINKNTKKYDIVLVDVYSDALVPFSLSTTEYTAKLRQSVDNNGFVAANLIGALEGKCSELLRSLNASYNEHFPFSSLYQADTADLYAVQNSIGVYSAKSLDWLPVAPVKISIGKVLTDNFAPVERMQKTCL